MALPSDPSEAVEELKARYPAWTVWGSDLGRYWATRQEALLRAGCSVTVSADTLHDLDALLDEQERLRERVSAREAARRRDCREIPFQTGEPT